MFRPSEIIGTVKTLIKGENRDDQEKDLKDILVDYEKQQEYLSDKDLFDLYRREVKHAIDYISEQDVSELLPVIVTYSVDETKGPNDKGKYSQAINLIGNLPKDFDIKQSVFKYVGTRLFFEGYSPYVAFFASESWQAKLDTPEDKEFFKDFMGSGKSLSEVPAERKREVVAFMCQTMDGRSIMSSIEIGRNQESKLLIGSPVPIYKDGHEKKMYIMYNPLSPNSSDKDSKINSPLLTGFFEGYEISKDAKKRGISLKEIDKEFGMNAEQLF